MLAPATARSATLKANIKRSPQPTLNTKETHHMKRCILTLAMMLALSAAAFAQIDTINTEKSSVTFSLAGQNANSNVAVTAGIPLPGINGHGAIYLARQTADGEVNSEIFNAELQGKWKFIEVVTSIERDIHRGIEREIQTAYRLNPGTLQVGPARLTGGIGNYTATTKVEVSAAGSEKQSSAISYGWSSYLQLDLWKTTTTVTGEPELDLKAAQVDIESTLRHAIDRNFEIGLTVKGYFDTHPPTDDRFHSQYLLFATWTR